MKSFPVPYTDHQIEVDTLRRVVMLYLNAWTRDSSATPDETYTFETLRSDHGLMVALTTMLAGSDGAELQRLVATD